MTSQPFIRLWHWLPRQSIVASQTCPQTPHPDCKMICKCFNSQLLTLKALTTSLLAGFNSMQAWCRFDCSTIQVIMCECRSNWLARNKKHTTTRAVTSQKLLYITLNWFWSPDRSERNDEAWCWWKWAECTHTRWVRKATKPMHGVSRTIVKALVPVQTENTMLVCLYCYYAQSSCTKQG